MLIWQRMTGYTLAWASGGRWLGKFSFGSWCSYWFCSPSAYCKVLMDQQKNHKHANITNRMRHETWSFHVIIQSVKTKNFPASIHFVKIYQKKNNYDVYPPPPLFVFFLLHEKERLFQSLMLANTSLPVFRHIRHLTTKNRHWSYRNIWKTVPSGRHYPFSEKVIGNVGIVLKF